MKKLMTLCAVLMLSHALFADWDPSHPAKWVQMPDLKETGIDVITTSPLVLADDFKCISTGPITDIHIWGSWLNDYLPADATGLPDASQVTFRLSLHSDILSGPNQNYSMPGQLLWEKYFKPGEFATRLYASNLIEGFYDPIQGYYQMPGDSQVWQYNFLIDPADAFIQQGTTAKPMIYWLDVEAFPVSVPGTVAPLFGWKTSLDHWNDDGVVGFGPNGPWRELVYPSNHPFAGQSMDLAFVITPEPFSMTLVGLGSLFAIRRRRLS